MPRIRRRQISLSGTGAAASYSTSLSWTASTSSVIGYNVYRGTTSGGPYTKLTASVDSNTSLRRQQRAGRIDLLLCGYVREFERRRKRLFQSSVRGDSVVSPTTRGTSSKAPAQPNASDGCASSASPRLSALTSWKTTRGVCLNRLGDSSKLTPSATDCGWWNANADGG